MAAKEQHNFAASAAFNINQSTIRERRSSILCRAIFESSVPSLPDLENLSKGSARAPSVCASVEARSKALATYLIYSLQDSVYKTGGAPKGVYTRMALYAISRNISVCRIMKLLLTREVTSGSPLF